MDAPTFRRRGFTLIEMLVALTIIVIIMITLFSVSAGVANIWKSTSGKISSFQNARLAFSTLSETLSRATLNTYSDYVNVTNKVYYFRHADASGAATDPGSISEFKPTQFARASELHFLSGPTADIAKASEVTSRATALPYLNATVALNPGHAVFFQAPLGFTKNKGVDSVGQTINVKYTGLQRMLNSVGFYVKYSLPEPSLVPKWLENSNAAKASRFRLVQQVEETEKLQIYKSTAGSAYSLNWLGFADATAPEIKVSTTRVLAEDVLLLVLRPRLSPGDERTVTAKQGVSYQASTQLGSVLCPNYQYDSRAWMATYPAAGRVRSGTNGVLAADDRVKLMMNQLPPVIDMAIVCADAQSLARYDRPGAPQDTPPTDLLVPDNLFKDSALLEADLAKYADQLSKKNIRFHVQRSTVELQSAKWSND